MIPPQTLDVAAFCALGVLTETQQIAHAAMEAVGRSDSEKVFAETLCLVSTATARTAAPAFPNGPERDHIAQALQALPLTLHSYVAGREVLDTGTGSAGASDDAAAALERMLDFYNVQLADVGTPDRKSLRHVLILWMGRISPPGLEEHPETRVERLQLVERLALHLRLVEAYARRAG